MLYFLLLWALKNKRNNLIEKLTQKNIPTVIYYKLPIHMMKAFDYLGYKDNDLPISKKLSQTIVSLPMHPYLASEDINKIIETIKR